jgi:outer membrane immunogenic protein
LATAIATIALIGTRAFAADIAVKAPSAPAPVYNWTGWYAGVNAGASFGDVKTDFNSEPITASVPNAIGGGSFVFSPIPGFAGSDTAYPSGFIGGGQIGHNWQVSPILVVGLEADFQGALERETNNLSNSFNLFVPTTVSGIPEGPISQVTGTAVTNYTTKIDWFGTARVRIGYVWGNGDVMSYLTGGLAYGKVDVGGTSTINGTVELPTAPFSVSNAFSHNAVNAGWVVGYGTEGKLLIPGWTLKAEALYMDLGHLDTTGVTTGSTLFSTTGAGTTIATGGQLTTHSHFTDYIVRVGLNYHFN